jgi:hypothetical protein
MAKYLSPFQFGTLATNENFIDRQEDRALALPVFPLCW